MSARLAVLLALLAAPAAAGPFDGTWSLDPSQCDVGHDPERLTVAGDQLWVYEELCRLDRGRAAASPPGAMIYGARCQGLGYDWSGRIVLAPMEGGRLAAQFEQPSPMRVYHRCP